MRHLHPASIILLGFALLIAATTRSGFSLLAANGGFFAAAMFLARAHLLRILRRSRWLLLTMLVLFAWMTPGTSIEWVPGATYEGLHLAVENLARLVIAIATVALVLGALDLSGLVYGLRALLAPLASLGAFRDRLAVRLMLTLQEVEAARVVRSADAVESVSGIVFEARAFRAADYLAVAVCACLLLFAGIA